MEVREEETAITSIASLTNAIISFFHAASASLQPPTASSVRSICRKCLS